MLYKIYKNYNMDDALVQACHLGLDMNKLKNEVLYIFEKEYTIQNLKYGNNNNWKKIHLWDCYNKDKKTKPSLWCEIGTQASAKFHYNLNLNDYLFKPNNTLNECPYIKEILTTITDNNLENARVYICDISILQKNGKVITHKDQNVRPYMEDETKWKRFHIPIITNDKVYFIINNDTYNLEEGVLYKLRTTFPHSVINSSDIDRYHLIIDIDPRYISKHLKWYCPTKIPYPNV